MLIGKKTLLLWFAGLTIFLMMEEVVGQRIDLEALKQQGHDGAEEISELRALLVDPDENLRLSIFDAMVHHGDPSLFEIATAMALVDASESLRARVLWEILSRRRSITVHIDRQNVLEDRELRGPIVDKHGGLFNLNLHHHFPEAGCINLGGSSQCTPNQALTVSGLLVTLHWQELQGELRLDVDGVLRGPVRDIRLNKVFPVEIDLR